MAAPSTARIIAAGAIGNVLEWYDFAVYGYFAAAIGRTFFPGQDPVAQVLAAFGIFAVGFLMRPVGGALVGHIGDRLGRRAALVFSVAAMAVPTFLVGVLPGYDTLGIAAPLLLTLLRMVQGLSVGGEYTTSVVFMVEQARPGSRGLIGAVTCCGAVGGILAGSATGAALASVMSPAALESWGWRVPFILGLVVGVAGVFLRRGIEETARPGGRTRSPIVDVLSNHRLLLLRLASLSMFNAVGFYVMFVYVVDWLQLVDRVAPARALSINTINMALLLPLMVAMGWLSDRIGRRPVMMAATAFAAIAAWPLFWLMHSPNSALEFLGQFGFVLAVGAFIACQPSIMAETVPARVRCTAIALGYNVTVGVAGGLAPLVATWLVERTGNDYSPAFLIMATAAISFAALISFRETFRMPLDGVPAAAD
jgi:MHS family proline/betaine transporter-like MFS transporter